ncbi:MAG TPA: cysteine desulfurase family protein [Phycisphaerae bacterium]|nr:cysteine desulfurase family protein [Phycisphaerae bacterium]
MNQAEKITYLDNAATTQIDPTVLARMVQVYTEDFGNSSNTTHGYGKRASELVELSRAEVALSLGALPREVIFTSGATESCNSAIKGVAELYSPRGRHIVLSQIEHSAVIEPCRRLERMGFELTWLRPDENGVIDQSQVADAIRRDTILVCVMAANNVTGVINPVADIASICKRRGVPYFCDATQAFGKIPLAFEEMGIDLMAVSSHKIYGPKGVGALVVRSRSPRVRISPLHDGGGQERGLRSGTLNTPGIVGFAKSCEIISQNMIEESAKISAMRNMFERIVTSKIPQIKILSHMVTRLPGISNIIFDTFDAREILKSIPQIAASAGAACGTDAISPNHVLLAMGLTKDAAAASVRFSFGRFNTEDEVRFAAELLAESFNRRFRQKV